MNEVPESHQPESPPKQGDPPLQEFFSILRREDALAAPRFESFARQGVPSRGLMPARWLRPVVAIAAVLALAALAGLPLLRPSRSTNTGPDSPTMIARAVPDVWRASTEPADLPWRSQVLLTRWEAPTGFLINPVVARPTPEWFSAP